nr:olfactory receptor 1052-like [Dasypus novemcinctus]
MEQRTEARLYPVLLLLLPLLPPIFSNPSHQPFNWTLTLWQQEKLLAVNVTASAPSFTVHICNLTNLAYTSSYSSAFDSCSLHCYTSPPSRRSRRTPAATYAVRTFEMNNQTHVTEFVFLGFSNHPNLQGLFFLIFLVIYLTTLLGNILIITATRASPALHTPMYYFLSGLSFLDICYTSTTIPVMLVNFFREKKTISYEGCLSQIFFLVTCAGSEGVLLAAMAYDRYVAICHPLQYPVLMSVKVCVCLVTGSWLCGLVNSMTHTVLAATLSLCGPNQISHFLCDIPLLLKLSCSDTSVNESVLHVASATIGLSPCLFTAVSYMLIISAILRIPSTQGRSKAFSTCASHLTVVVVFFGTANFNYDRPSEGYSLDMDILVSVLFCVMTPMLNPIIYSLRNKEIKGALWKLVGDHGTRVK